MDVRQGCDVTVDQNDDRPLQCLNDMRAQSPKSTMSDLLEFHEEFKLRPGGTVLQPSVVILDVVRPQSMLHLLP